MGSLFAGACHVLTDAREHPPAATVCSVVRKLFAFAFTARGPLAAHKSVPFIYSLFADTRVVATAREHSRPQSDFLWAWALFHFIFPFILLLSLLGLHLFFFSITFMPLATFSHHIVSDCYTVGQLLN